MHHCLSLEDCSIALNLDGWTTVLPFLGSNYPSTLPGSTFQDLGQGEGVVQLCSKPLGNDIPNPDQPGMPSAS